MQTKHWLTFSLVGISPLTLWLLLVGPREVLGIDAGAGGTALMVTIAWTSLFALYRTPRNETGTEISPGEWKAWIGGGFMLIAIVYLLTRIAVFEGAVWNDQGVRTVVGNIMALLVAWGVLSHALATRWRGQVEQDERDRWIEQVAGGYARSALTACAIGIAVMLAFSPEAKLQWATHFMIAYLLLLAIMVALLFQYAATVMYYRRDRK